jgi:hypothetical protein
VNGGKTELYNENLLCPICHALAHAGLLKITGDPIRGLRFETVCDRTVVDLREEFQMLVSLPEVRLAGLSGVPDAGRGLERSALSVAVKSTASGAPDFPVPASSSPVAGVSYPSWLYDGVLKAMQNIGYSRESARKRLERAWEIRSRQSEKVTEEEAPPSSRCRAPLWGGPRSHQPSAGAGSSGRRSCATARSSLREAIRSPP